MAQKRSEDINAFLFSIENVEELRTLREIDRNLYSYNALLRNGGMFDAMKGGNSFFEITIQLQR